MKKCSITYLLVIALLLFATFFSMSLTPVHMDDCQHTVCEHCQEIVAVENEVNAMLEGHGECRETACETCVFIEKQGKYDEWDAQTINFVRILENNTDLSVMYADEDYGENLDVILIHNE